MLARVDASKGHTTRLEQSMALNRVLSWGLAICGTLVTAGLVSLIGMILTMQQDIAVIKTSMENMLDVTNYRLGVLERRLEGVEESISNKVK